MKVANIMSKKMHVAQPTSSLSDIWKLIYQKHVHGVPVVDRHHNLLGIVSEEDILVRLYPHYDEFITDFASHNFTDMEKKAKELSRLQAKDVMNKNIHLAHDDEPIMQALSKMFIYEVRQLPVINSNNKLVGIISRGDIFDILFKKYLNNAA